MRKISVLIIDDEAGAHKVLENYIGRMPGLELAGHAFNALEAIAFMKNTPVNLIFLDITMPEVNGFAFLQMLQKPPFVIFTTAYSEFAAESYDYNAVDYLKKPIPFERFSKAIDKLMRWIGSDRPPSPANVHIDLRIDGTTRSIPLDQILFIQSLGNYVKVFLDKKVLISQITTKELEEHLPRSSFLRIHKSYIVNKSRIDVVADEQLMIGNIGLPIGKTFKKYVKELMHGY
jgi:DNA-binding LytR/AlgR family response regulator